MIVDAIVGMLLLTLAFGAIISTMVVGIKSGRRGREYQNAGLAARQVVENVRSFRGGQVAVGTYQDARTLGAVPQLDNLQSATVSASVTTFSTRSRQVVVVVSWYSTPGNRTVTEKFTTLFSADGVTK
jgi:hypothetical protein